MKIKNFLLIFLLFAFDAAMAESPLRNHPSPYLAMHADDPVQWQRWSPQLFERARRENRLIFISSGYFSCHWCHVMQRESFRHEATAALLNSEFIPVKIDRQREPALDSYLLDFVTRTRGVAGWPLNVFITPEGRPLLGSGYLPQQEFLALLRRLAVRWQNEGGGLRELASRSEMTPLVAQQGELAEPLPSVLMQALLQQADLLAGGFGEGAKFPDLPQLKALLQLDAEDEELQRFVTFTLRQIATQGLHDQVGGGFFRYCTDPAWQLPHFEKMLYDNAQLAAFFLQVGETLHDSALQQVGMDTLDFILGEMRHPDGGYIAALSAVDGHGLEGGYYLWREEQLRAALPLAEQRLFHIGWRLQEAPQWVGGLPIPQLDSTQLAARLSLDIAEAEAWQQRIKGKLLAMRKQRQLPRDGQRIAAWNGLLLSALARAAPLAGRYTKAGQALRRHLANYWHEGRLWRFASGEVVGTLEDYLFVAQGLFDWWQFTGSREDRELAMQLLNEALNRFEVEGLWRLDEEGEMGSPQLLFREGPMPSPVVTLLQLDRRYALGLSLEATIAQLQQSEAALRATPFDYPGYIRLLVLQGPSGVPPAAAPGGKAAAPAAE